MASPSKKTQISKKSDGRDNLYPKVPYRKKNSKKIVYRKVIEMTRMTVTIDEFSLWLKRKN